MSVSAERYSQLVTEADAEPSPSGVSEYDKLDSVAQVLAFAHREFAAEDASSAVDMVEMLVRSAGLDASAVRRIEATLRPLGFIELSDRLREIAGRRKYDLRPLP